MRTDYTFDLFPDDDAGLLHLGPGDAEVEWEVEFETDGSPRIAVTGIWIDRYARQRDTRPSGKPFNLLRASHNSFAHRVGLECLAILSKDADWEGARLREAGWVGNRRTGNWERAA